MKTIAVFFIFFLLTAQTVVRADTADCPPSDFSSANGSLPQGPVSDKMAACGKDMPNEVQTPFDDSHLKKNQLNVNTGNTQDHPTVNP